MDTSLVRLRQRIAALAEEHLATSAVLERAHALTQRALPSAHAVWATLDPATGLFTSCLRFGLEGFPDREHLVIENELEAEDVNHFSQLARGPRHAAALALATGGEPERSARFRALGAELPLVDELRIALVSRGNCWGTATLYRGAEEHPFTEADVAFADTIAVPLGEALRLSMVRALAQAAPQESDGPGVVVLCDDGTVDSATEGARRMMRRLRPDGGVPPAVTSVVLACRRGDASGSHVRAEDASGRWTEMHASRLDGNRVAVVMEDARAPVLARIIVEACGLTSREREVTELVLRGASTKDIASALTVTEYTVQDHLKSVFDKTGVRSRRELAALLSDRYYRVARERGAQPGPYGWFVPQDRPA